MVKGKSDSNIYDVNKKDKHTITAMKRLMELSVIVLKKSVKRIETRSKYKESDSAKQS